MVNSGSLRAGVTRWVASRKREAVAGVVCVMLPLAVSPTAQQARAVTLVGITGHWTASDDGGPTLTVDGTKWSGTTDSSTLIRASTQFFGASNPVFISNGVAAGAFPLAVAPAVQQFSTGTLRVRFKLIGGASDQNAGIVFGLQPDGSYHYLRYNTKDGDLALWAYADGARRNIAHGEAKHQFALGNWQTLEVQIDGTTLTARVAGDSGLRFTHTLASVPTGRVGVWVKRDAVTAFQGFDAVPGRAR